MYSNELVCISCMFIEIFLPKVSIIAAGPPTNIWLINSAKWDSDPLNISMAANPKTTSPTAINTNIIFLISSFISNTSIVNNINATLSEIADPTFAPIVGDALMNKIISDNIGTIILGSFLFIIKIDIAAIEDPMIIPWYSFPIP